MSSFSIGLTGLQVAQQALGLVGTNITNAGTEGYHRQRPVIAPLQLGSSAGVSYGGSRISEVTRCYDKLLETELLSQKPLMGQVDKELFTLKNIESALGELDSDNVMKSLEKFFNGLRELAAQPDSQALQEKAVWAADNVAQQLRNLAAFLTRIEKHIRHEGHELAQTINNTTSEIAELNTDIESAMMRGESANILQDERDQRIKDLAELVDVKVEYQQDHLNNANILVWGMPLVVGGHVSNVDVSTLADGQLGISMEGSSSVYTDVEGGTLGGLITLQNELVPDIRGSVDNFTRELISQINHLHVEGIAPDGSFTELAGAPVGDSTELADLPWNVYDGQLHIRVTNTADGTVERHAVDVDVSGGDTIQDMAAKFDSIDGLKGWTADSALKLASESGYEFDFSRSVLPEPTASDFTGTARPGISGTFTGDKNQTFTCTIAGEDPDGTEAEIGGTPDLLLEVRNEAGEVIKHFDIGPGYAPGDTLDLGNGIELNIGDGTVHIGESFEIDAWSKTDTSGFLAATGLNTFFSGTNASTIAVQDRILERPGNFASGSSAEYADNSNVSRMAEIGDQSSENLNGQTPIEFFQTFITGIGEAVNVRKGRQSSLENINTQLMEQRDNISGVDINEQTARLMVFERMFQAAAKVISIQNLAMSELMNIV